MSTIKVQIPVSPETIEREVQLPAYRKDKDSGRIVKIISEYEYVSVYENGESFTLQRFDLYCVNYLRDRNYSDCSKEEFEKAYERVLDRLYNLQIQEA